MRTIQQCARDQIERPLVAQQSATGESAALETSALIESVAIALALHPRSVLYLSSLARNRLLVAISASLEDIYAVQSALADVDNITYTIKDFRQLQRAKNALVQAETSNRVSAESLAVQTYQSAVNTFLEKQLSKNVRRRGSSSLVRTKDEALTDLAVGLQNLYTDFDDVRSRLTALSTGVADFIASPYWGILGAMQIRRTRREVESTLSSLQRSSANSRDATVGLLTSKAALSTFLVAPDPYLPVLDPAQDVPKGRAITARSEESSAVALGSLSPSNYPADPNLTVTVESTTTVSPFPQATPSFSDDAVVVSDSRIYPVTAPAHCNLLVRVNAATVDDFIEELDGTYTHDPVAGTCLGMGWRKDDTIYYKTFKIEINATASPISVSQLELLADINVGLTQAFTYPPGYNQPGVHTVMYGGAEQFVGLSDRIVIYSDGSFFSSIAFIPTVIWNTESTIGVPALYTDTAGSVIGVEPGTSRLAGECQTTDIADAVNALFSTVTASVHKLGTGDTIQITTVATDVGTELTLSGSVADSFGLTGSYKAQSSRVVLVENGNSISPLGLCYIQDLLTLGDLSGTIEAITEASIKLSAPTNTVEGIPLVTSPLVPFWQIVHAVVCERLAALNATAFATDLKPIQDMYARVLSNPSKVYRGALSTLINDLYTWLNEAYTYLSSPMLPPDCAPVERAVVDRVLGALQEKKFDRAVDLLTGCAIDEFFQLSWRNSSYGGALTQTLSDVMRTDMAMSGPKGDSPMATIRGAQT